jgi:hypothetical protein
MKRNNIFKIFALAAVLVTGLSSCNDFLTIYPTDKTIGEDFWKTKEDVQGMVTGAYGSMISYGCQERAIIWGAYRSDELVKYSSYNNTNLENISAVNLLPQNSYNSWESFYAVINRCNIVLNHAADVMENDPAFTKGDYDETRAQMLALRSLCYFYLVRTFRDVPYTTQSYEDDDQEMVIPQVAPDSVLQYCINDLEEAERYIMKSGAYGKQDWRNVGYFTRDAVRALLADIYLWRASINHSQADYQKCISYADQIIKAKDEYFQANTTGMAAMDKDPYHLIDRDMAFSSIFVDGNSSESILEWQYDGSNNSNLALENLYYETGNSENHQTTSALMASQIFNFYDEKANTAQGQKVYVSKNDYRYWYNVYGVNSEEATELSVRKMVSQDSYVSSGNQASTDPTKFNVGETQNNRRTFDNYRQNWIVYRLTDVMLMKAEALVQTAANDSDRVVLDQAFNLVQAVNKRSMAKNVSDTLQISAFPDRESMELLVLAERERELCFEGKRWFDLMRYCYRHMEGVDLKTKLADRTEWPTLYAPMLALIVRKYVTGGEAVSYKMKSEPFLYWPIQERELKVNNLLKQNPVFEQENTTQKQ